MSDRFDALLALLQDPAGNLAAVAAAVAIVVVFVVIVVLVLIAVALPSDRKQVKLSRAAAGLNEKEDLPPRRLGLPGCLIAIVLTLIGLAGAVALWYEQTSTNAYCAGTCHTMAGAANTWQTSAHSSIDCIRCHEGRKWDSLPTGVSHRTYDIYLQVTGQRPRAQGFDEDTCRECHSGVLRAELTGRNGEPFRHTEILTGGKRCSECHGQQGHVEAR